MATASVTHTFANSTTADATQVNTNFTDLVTFLNNSVVHKDGSGPILTGDRLYVGDLSGNLYAFDAGDGSEIWQVTSDKLDGKIVGSPLVIDEDIYIGTESGKLFNLDTSGNIKWTQTLNGKLYTSPTAAGDLILVASTQPDELLTAFTRQGAKQWTFNPEPKKEE